MLHPSRALRFTAALGLLAACAPDSPAPAPVTGPSANRAGYDLPGAHRQYGQPQRLGGGMVRTYVVADARSGQAPLELGVAIDEAAMESLPGGDHEHHFVLSLPPLSPAPFQFVLFNWNPHGHEPEGVYTVPHFDFHFYTSSLAERNSILPSDPEFEAKARNLPTGDFVPPHYVVPGPPERQAVPQMGVHWVDVRSPELQRLMGRPERYQPFTKTFIYGSWNGRLTFFEPMVTVEYLRSRPDIVTEIPVPARYPAPGYYPTSYRVTYDARAREYRVALTGLVESQ